MAILVLAHAATPYALFHLGLLSFHNFQNYYGLLGMFHQAETYEMMKSRDRDSLVGR